MCRCDGDVICVGHNLSRCCCIGFASLDVVFDELVPGILVCNSFLVSVCMFIVSKVLLISSATVSVRAGDPFGSTPLLRCCIMCIVPSL